MNQDIKTVMHLLKNHPESIYSLNCVYEFTNFSRVNKNSSPGF
jgi:hypothetical protein